MSEQSLDQLVGDARALVQETRALGAPPEVVIDTMRRNFRENISSRVIGTATAALALVDTQEDGIKIFTALAEELSLILGAVIIDPNGTGHFSGIFDRAGIKVGIDISVAEIDEEDRAPVGSEDSAEAAQAGVSTD